MEVLEKSINREQRLELVKEGIAKGVRYDEYRNLVRYLAENHKATGSIQSEEKINYTQLSDRRMKRWDKTFKIPSELQEKIARLNMKLQFLVLTESWCGDASSILPVINKVAELNPNIDLKIVIRDENPELMDAFLTHGTRSIPKLIILDKEKEEIVGEWGPRPSKATQMVEDEKREHGKLTAEFKKDLQMWYNKDKGANILSDLLELLPLE